MTFLRFGMSLEEALRQAMIDLRALDDPYASEMNIVAITADGNHGGASTAHDKTYIHMDEINGHFRKCPRLHVPLEGLGDAAQRWVSGLEA